MTSKLGEIRVNHTDEHFGGGDEASALDVI